MKAHSQSLLSAILTAALIFLAFSFVKVSFDIMLWSEEARFLCVLVTALCSGLGVLFQQKLGRLGLTAPPHCANIVLFVF